MQHRKSIRLETTGREQGDLLGIMQEIEDGPCEQMVHAQPRLCHGERNTQTPLGS